MAKMDAKESRKFEGKEFNTCTSGSKCWLHIRILYGVVLCLTLVTGLSLWYCVQEIIQLRKDFEGEILPRGMIDITEPHTHFGYKSWDEEDEDELDGDENENFTSPEGLPHNRPPLDRGDAQPGYEVLDGTTPEEEELIRVKRRALRSPKKSKRSRKRKRDKDNRPSFFYANGDQDNGDDHGSGNGSPDQHVWLTSYSRIPVFALQEFCAATKDYCPPGQAGLQGPPGLPGVQGRDGLKGEEGDKGSKGTAGLPGLDGLDGLDGKMGKPGPKGDKGEPGMTSASNSYLDEDSYNIGQQKCIQCPPGPPGLPGPPGKDGEEGPPGLEGPPGVNGTTGRRGKRGRLGEPGPPGEKGDLGESGLPGPKGDTGEPGLDADTQNCTCPPGPYATGPPGPIGPKGPDGSKGQKGEPGRNFVSGSNLVLDTTIATTTTTTPVPTTISTTVEPTIEPRISSCRIRMVGKPLFQRYTGTYWGAWMKDTFKSTAPDVEKFWFTRHFTGKSLYEYNNQDEFRADRQSTMYSLDDLYFGTGHAVYNGAFFYHKSGTSNLIKFDLEAREVTGETRMPDAAYQGKDCVYSTEYNYMDIAADGNGLWVIYNTADGAMNLMVSKVNPDTMVIEKTWNISVPHRRYGNGFITCGVLYLIKNTHAKTTLIDFAYDLYTKTQLTNVRLQFTNPFQMNNMISYNPVDRKIYSWDKGNQLTYPLLL